MVLLHTTGSFTRKPSLTELSDDKQRRIAWISAPDLISPSKPHDSSKPDSPKKPRFAEIAIVGLKIALNPSAAKIRRLIWWIVLCTCFTLMLIQTHNRLEYYLSTPVSTNVRYLRNNTLVFPAVILCPYRMKLDNDTSHLDPHKIESLYATHYPPSTLKNHADAMYQLADIYDVNDIWEKTAVDLREYIAQCYYGRGKKCDIINEFAPVNTVLGRCVRYTPPPVTVSGQFHGLYMKLCPDVKRDSVKSFYLLVDDINDAPELRALTHGFYVEYSWNKEISVFVKEFYSQNRPQKECSQNEKKTATRCAAACFHRHFVQKAGCRLPYMDSPNEKPYCSGSKQLFAADEIHRDMLWEGIGWHPDTCECSKTTCKQRLYGTFADSSERGDNCARYKVFFTDMTYEETTEEFSYDIISFLCDVGGTLGLLLGASVLTMFQVTEVTCYKICKLLARLFSSDGTSNTKKKTSTVKEQR